MWQFPHRSRSSRKRLPLVLLVFIVSFATVPAWRSVRTTDNRQWCEQVEEPLWPFSYSKFPTNTENVKGRSTSNLQDYRHNCTTRCARSLCHVCEDFACRGPNGTATCHYQLQGIEQLSVNIPTVNDVPFAIGTNIRHRYDYENAEVICLFLQGERCISTKTSDFSGCAMRCWGTSYAPPTRYPFGWQYPKAQGLPQGRVTTFAGQPKIAGFRDGPADTALFRDPAGVAVDYYRNVYVADTGNHCIRKILPDGTVSTFAGTPGVAGEVNGPVASSMFSSPTGIALYYDDLDSAALVVFVADTGNHVIRRIRQTYGNSSVWMVDTWVGGGSARQDGIGPQGLQDGFRTEARFFSPHGLAVDRDGWLYVADSGNHVIRQVTPQGNVTVVAGTVRDMRRPQPNREPETGGCPDPCLEGVPGFDDGPRLTAKFNYPWGVSLGENGTLVVTDGHRVRRITTSSFDTSQVQGIWSFNRVVTLAGGLETGFTDGIGEIATFNGPTGVAVAPDGRIYVTEGSNCRVRRITPADVLAQNLQCSTRLVDVLRPGGCALYDPPVTVHDRMISNKIGNVYYAVNSTTRNGHVIPQCLGTPPPNVAPSATGILVSTLSMAEAFQGYNYPEIHDQLDVGDTYRFYCPPGCAEEAINLSEVVVGNDTESEAGVIGDEYYADVSRICASAAHAGVIGDSGGLISVTVQSQWGPLSGLGTLARNRALNGTTRNNITSVSSGNATVTRSFTIAPYPLSWVEVDTIGGFPTSALTPACGFEDAQPAQESKFDTPHGIAFYQYDNPTDTDFVYIADTKNHVIRAMTAVCAKMCENGGRCVGADLCKCAAGWTGDDCTTPVCETPCGHNRICIGNNTCACRAGYAGPTCQDPLCQQRCLNGGKCGAPDTCNCINGWYDPQCKTPTCTQTCGNGGNCTSPDICTCPTDWQGRDCRIPVCRPACINGDCVAPDTCKCRLGWSGHDCSKPVCNQGMFRPDPNPAFAPASSVTSGVLRPLFWNQYLPCNLSEWVVATNEFDFLQAQKKYVSVTYDANRSATGFHSWSYPGPAQCFAIELAVFVDIRLALPYSFDLGNGNRSIYCRYCNETLYPDMSYAPLADGGRVFHPWSSPFSAVPDRQVAWVHYLNVTQGVYVCANGGNCTAPNVCSCAPGWAGFDCRTPICNQGWYNYSRIEADPVTGVTPRFLHQGSYRCSRRSVTVWENPPTPLGKFTGYVHGHPNYFSRYMRDDMGWPAVHLKHPGLGNDTKEGWRRDGWWYRSGEDWEFGICPPNFKRTCPAGSTHKAVDLRTGSNVLPVNDTDFAFRARERADTFRVTAAGRWVETGGECIDHVMDGCFNNGTCVAPDTCKCAPGWEGHDCSLPVCTQSIATITNDTVFPTTLLRAAGENYGDPSGNPTPPALLGDTYPQYRKCANNGNCTLPNTCTCEKGWTGVDCRTPICAQDCFNGGLCVAPDVCACPHWYSKWRDGRGLPVFRKPNGDPMDTGYVGFDCNVPVCTQAEQWILNTNNVTEAIELQASANLGNTFAGNCIYPSRFAPLSTRTRVSEVFCNLVVWYQGSYLQPWSNSESIEPLSIDSPGRYVKSNFPNYIKINENLWVAGPLVSGEGLYACYNGGSCVQPEVCECMDGWAGLDCSVPLCRYLDARGRERTCQNGGICGFRQQCTCVKRHSLLYIAHKEAPQVVTGYQGDDCSVAKCTQGWYDPNCTGVNDGVYGCYRCANGGNCTAPDYCTCPPEWTGYDCRTPVCSQHADEITVANLNTVDPMKILQFELDPCGSEFTETIRGAQIGRGNCSQPNVCTCMCRVRSWQDASGNLVKKPWKDPLSRSIPLGYIYGRFDCLDGWEGNLNVAGQFTSCHLQVYVPSWFRRNTVTIIIVACIVAFFLLVFYIFLRRKLRQRYLLAKAERRRSRRSSEEEGAADDAKNQ